MSYRNGRRLTYPLSSGRSVISCGGRLHIETPPSFFTFIGFTIPRASRALCRLPPGGEPSVFASSANLAAGYHLSAFILFCNHSCAKSLQVSFFALETTWGASPNSNPLATNRKPNVGGATPRFSPTICTRRHSASGSRWCKTIWQAMFARQTVLPRATWMLILPSSSM